MPFHNKLELLSLASLGWLMFAGKAGAYPSEEPFRFHSSPHSTPPLLGRLLALLKNIRLGWKGLAGANALAYYEKVQLMKSLNLRP
jgi:hypothetical protein